MRLKETRYAEIARTRIGSESCICMETPDQDVAPAWQRQFKGGAGREIPGLVLECLAEQVIHRYALFLHLTNLI